MKRAPGIEAGRHLVIPEQHYCYGVGTLTLRLTEPVAPPHPNAEWLRVVGREIDWRGVEAATPREVLVRVAAIPFALKPANWTPPSR